EKSTRMFLDSSRRMAEAASRSCLIWAADRLMLNRTLTVLSERFRICWRAACWAAVILRSRSTLAVALRFAFLSAVRAAAMAAVVSISMGTLSGFWLSFAWTCARAGVRAAFSSAAIPLASIPTPKLICPTELATPPDYRRGPHPPSALELGQLRDQPLDVHPGVGIGHRLHHGHEASRAQVVHQEPGEDAHLPLRAEDRHARHGDGDEGGLV